MSGREVSHWRLAARAVITEVLAAQPGDIEEHALKQALSAAYPFHERRYYPYKIWLWEVRAALALRYGRPAPPPFDPRSRRQADQRRHAAAQAVEGAGQLELEL